MWGGWDESINSSLSNSAFQPTGRIQQLAGHLEGLGFTNHPQVQMRKAERTFLEVFPSPAQVILFPCMTHSGHTHCRPPRYKHKRGRSWLEVQCEWDVYRARLRSLQLKEPALKFSTEVKQALGVDASEMTGVRYKILDDLLDGIFCAYLAYYFWYWGEERCWVVGDMDTGCVTLPRCRLPNCQLKPTGL